VQVLEFSEFEIQMDDLCREKGTITYFGSELANIEYQEIANEVVIQDCLIEFKHVTLNESTIAYAETCLKDSVKLRTKLRYLFLINNLENRKKYQCAKEFVDYFFEHTEELSQIEKEDDNLLTYCINILLEVCVRMRLRVDDIWDYLDQYLTRNPNSVYYHVINALPLLTSEEKIQGIRDLTEQQLSLDAETGNYTPIEIFLDNINKVKGFIIERELVLRRLAEAYMRRTEYAENSPMIGITFSQKAASIYKRLGDNELENKCLSVLGKFLELESPEWHESVTELGDYNFDNIKILMGKGVKIIESSESIIQCERIKINFLCICMIPYILNNFSCP
jgi:hypothetical protein